MRADIASLITRFGLPAARSMTPLDGGLINASYRVSTEAGDFVLQRLHAVVPDTAVADMAAVTNRLAASGMVVPRLLRTAEGSFLARDPAGHRWRAYSWLPGQVREVFSEPAVVEDAARLLGRMHRFLAEAPRPQGSIPHFHDTRHVRSRLVAVAASMPAEARALCDEALALLPAAIAEDSFGIPQTVHGDPKTTNVLLDDAGRAVGMLDFDTLLWHSRGVDVGDAFRTWCNPRPEDDAAAALDTDLFRAGVEGYAAGWGVPADAVFMQACRRAFRWMTLEVAARFLTDVVEDSYFAFDAARYPSRRAHNVARAAAQLALARSAS